jgi:hypothetical protein
VQACQVPYFRRPMGRMFFQAFVDYLLAEGRDLTLLDFREEFNEWLQEKLEKHEDKPSQGLAAQCGLG